MLTVILYTLRESFHRRMGLVLIVIAGLVPATLLWKLRFQTLTDGKVLVYMGHGVYGQAANAVPNLLTELLKFTGGVWLLLGIFAGAPLLTSFMERGWVELLLSKGIPR